MCDSCRADLHVCEFCIHYNPSFSDRCDQSLAERPREFDRANFCDFFKINEQAYQRKGRSSSQQARAQLDALFGGKSEGGQSKKSKSSDKVFQQVDKKADKSSDLAKQQLNALFGLNDDKSKS